jgi:hypothetical protein
MTLPLVTDAQMLSLRAIAERGMKDDVTISTRTRITDEDDDANVYGDDGETWTVTATVKGWLYSAPSPTIDTLDMRMALTNTYRLFLPVGTVIETGDRVEIDGRQFIVSDTVGESTWLPLLRVSLRRAD